MMYVLTRPQNFFSLEPLFFRLQSRTDRYAIVRNVVSRESLEVSWIEYWIILPERVESLRKCTKFEITTQYSLSVRTRRR